MKFERPRGTRDFSPVEMAERACVEGGIADVVEGFGYARVETPMFEHAELFELKSGGDVSDKMYVFEDKGGRRVCLRPEVTAQVARMFASSLKVFPKPLRLYYAGPMFRYERPQKGRYRQFWQIGVELLGAQGSLADAEVIQLACECLESIGLEYELKVNSLGVLRGLMDELSVDSARQARVLGLIDKGDFAGARGLVGDTLLADIVGLRGSSRVLGEAGKMLEGYGKPVKALKEIEETAGILDALNVSYVIDFSVARGLEYYTGMVFEAGIEGLGAQKQVCGGGRYDNLIGLFGGPDTPAVGFAFGFDRLMEAARLQGIELKHDKKSVLVVPVNEQLTTEAARLAGELRRGLRGSGVSVMVELTGRKLSKSLTYASEAGLDYTVIVGDKELAEKKVVVKDLREGRQETVEVGKLGGFLL